MQHQGTTHLLILFGMLFSIGGVPRAIAQVPEPKIDSRAAAIFTHGCDLLAYAENFSFKAHQKIKPELVANSSRMAEIDIEVRVSRPDKVIAIAKGKVGERLTERRIYIHPLGSALYDVAMNLVVPLPPSESIDETIAEIRQYFSIPMPLADFVVNDPYNNFSSRLLEAKYLGTEEIRGMQCYHVLYLGTTMDWEVWVSEDALARRFVVSIKGLPGKNHIEADFLEWNMDIENPEEDFVFQIPEGAQTVGPPPQEFLGENKIKELQELANDIRKKGGDEAPSTSVAGLTINRPHRYFIPEGTPTEGANGERCFLIDGSRFRPYLYDGGPVFIDIDSPGPSAR